jgi:hypothetical protein
MKGKKYSRLFSFSEFFVILLEIFQEDRPGVVIFPATGSIVPGPGIVFCRDFLLPDLHEDPGILHLS